MKTHYELLASDPRTREQLTHLISLDATGRDRFFAAAPDKLGMARLFYLLLAFVDAGRQVFEVGPQLVELFLESSVKGLQQQDLRFPYPAFYLHVPSGLGVLTCGGPPVQATGLYVRTRGEQLDFSLWGPGDVMTTDAVQSFVLQLQPEDDLIAVVQRALAGPPPITANAEAIERALRVLVGALLYLTLLDKEVAREERGAIPREVRKRLERAGKTPPKGVTILRLGPSLERVTPAPGAGDARGPVRLHWVRGHFSKYWVGTGDAKTQELRWLKPYQRGSGPEAQLEQRLYRLKKEGT